MYNDPTDQAVYCVYCSRMPCVYNSMDTGCNADLNCEHTVPQSFFNKQDLMVSDTHHLRTAWSKANNGRQNYPFKRLNGTSGTFFGPNFTQTTKQPPQIENWSVLDKGLARDRFNWGTRRGQSLTFTPGTQPKPEVLPK
ncbi:Endonuclease_I [Hexamita inflata]|uniref:Endonuclease I n=1 Tax=Hexamita inflata TaxID=28002 RepID=A0AA86TNT8_9EUKA|nr:Endonuclease I [Hexamita inflata]CAI9940469.1 Endonuclease I [Hexamita inflata]